MTRQKKSRKSNPYNSAKKTEQTKVVESSDKRSKKYKGNKPGSRQQEAQIKQEIEPQNKNKDPRIGNKTPILLIKPSANSKANSTTQIEKKVKPKKSPMAEVRVVETNENTKIITKPELETSALETEIYAIEDDQKLQNILAKQEDEIALTDVEVDYFNDKMARHQEISTLLGWDDDVIDDEDELSNDNTSEDEKSEESLWNKFNDTDR